MFTRFPVFKCFKPQNDLSPYCEKSGKRYVRITAKRHAHLQTLTKTPAKFQKDPAKL